MASFPLALAYCLENEGGFVNRKQDRGGPTNKGITIPIFAKFRGRMVSIEELQNISDNEVSALYEEFFWAPLKIESLPQGVATAILDTAINQGQSAAIKLAQESVGLAADGIMGEKTITALSDIHPKEFIFRYVEVIQDKYVKICLYATNQMVFLEGWLRRSRRLYTLCF